MILQNGNEFLISCSLCGVPLGDQKPGLSTAMHCFGCGSALEVEVFPALFVDGDRVAVGASLQADSEASCFYHPENQAIVPCESCGRFLCALCETPIAGQRLCPSCVEQGRTRGRLTELVTQRTLYDQIALSLAIVPLLIFWLTIITAPMAVYFACRHWRSPTSLLPRTKIRFVAAIALASLQVFGWLSLLAYLYS